MICALSIGVIAMKIENEKCWCLEIFKKKYGEHVQGDCLKQSCARYRAEKRKELEKDKTNQ
jgi:hypothetical protein